MEIGKILPAPQTNPASAKGTEVPLPQPRSHVSSEPVRIAATEEVDLTASDERRMEAIKRAVTQAQAKDVYPVSDSTFAIYKDASGQYVTRFTSLRDGSVSYYPEPQLLKHLSNAGIDIASIGVDA